MNSYMETLKEIGGKLKWHEPKTVYKILYLHYVCKG